MDCVLTIIDILYTKKRLKLFVLHIIIYSKTPYIILPLLDSVLKHFKDIIIFSISNLFCYMKFFEISFHMQLKKSKLDYQI